MTEVILFAALPAYLRVSISEGVTRHICPKCNGGRSNEASLDVRQKADGILSLKCFRSTCGWYALTMTDPDVRLQSRKISEGSVYREPFIAISPLLAGELYRMYGLRASIYGPHGWSIGPQSQLVMPVRDPYGGVRGHVTRTFEKPKRCYAYKATAQPWLDWWAGFGAWPCVVVEDCLSACRLAGLGYYAVALLGTSISVDQAKEIATVMQKKDVYLALDRDAFVKAQALAKRHAHIVKMLPICLNEDIKNIERDEDIHKLFEGSL